MEAPKTKKSEEKIRVALMSKWSRITLKEVKDIMIDHDKLPPVLKTRYSMTKDNAEKECAQFFKPFEARKVAG